MSYTTVRVNDLSKKRENFGNIAHFAKTGIDIATKNQNGHLDINVPIELTNQARQYSSTTTF